MKVAIIGYGVEGKAAQKYYQARGDEITIFDEATEVSDLLAGVTSRLGPDSFTDINGFDLILRSPGISPAKVTADRPLSSLTKEFFAACPAPIVGVTGTKGKGTTASLIAAILSEAGNTVHLVGNIGIPALEVLDSITLNDIVVYELSSFQLWDMEMSPQVAVVLMIEPDHLNVHADFEDYVTAKSHIASCQSPDDLVVYHPTNHYSARIAETSAGQRRRYGHPEGAHVDGGNIVIDEHIICSTSSIGLIGPHNIDNVCAAVTAAWRYTQGVTAIARAVAAFKGLPHRLEMVREVTGVRYINDSFSSAPGATIAALNSFNEPKVMIVGGFDRGIDFGELAKACSASRRSLRRVLCIGQTGPRIAQNLRESGVTQVEELAGAPTMDEIVRRAAAEAEPGDVVVLSPGCASFDMFHSFYERGEAFKVAVGKL